MKIKHLTILFLALIAPWMANANPVDQKTAREVALKYVNAKAQTPLRGANDLQLVTTYHINRGDDAFHIFNTPTGFVIVSADDCATPILGYSDEGQFDTDNIPIQLQDYLQGFVKQIEYGIENHLVADETTAKRWKQARASGQLSNSPKYAVVGPLLTTKWSQYCYYNALCPEDPNGSCGHVPTGCVATAMAQIMRYWSYPYRGSYSHSYLPPNGYPEQYVDFGATVYDWDNMPNSLTSTSSSEQVNAVATLMWHCGVSVYTMYNTSESSASNADAGFAFPFYFNYSDDFSSEEKDDNPLFMQHLKDCLDQSRPVLYFGSSGTTGHALVCDGYNTEDLFHFNWGWGGLSDGYFALDALNGFNTNNSAYFNIHPKGEQGASYQVTVSTNSSSEGSVTGTGQYSWGNDCTVTATPNQGYHFLYWMENGSVVSTQPSYTFMVVEDRNLVAEFSTTDPNFDYIQFADSQVKALCVANWDTNGDGELSKAEAAGVRDLSNVFSGNTTITSFDELQFFKGLSLISYMAFFGCSGLTSIVIPNNVTVISESAFDGCSGLTSINIPISIIQINRFSFNNCNSLTAIYYEGNLMQYCNVKFYSNWCNFLDTSNPLKYAHNLYINNELVTDLVIPETIAEIQHGAFEGARCLTSVTIPNSVISIGEYAFADCSNLTSITIPNSVTSIGEGAFKDCIGLTSLTIGNSVTQIGRNAFFVCWECSSLHYIYALPEIPPTVGDFAFTNADNPLVFVPCGYESAYQSSQEWGSFEIIGSCGHIITIAPEPSGGGTVTGSGAYIVGSECTLTAIPSGNNIFTCWTENGERVSTNAHYSFIVTGNRELVAHFFPIDQIIPFADYNVEDICLNHWDTDNNYVLSYSEAASVNDLGSVFRSCNTISSFDELQFFTGLTGITDLAFYGCSSLTSVTIPRTVNWVGYNVFVNTGLTTLTILAPTPPNLQTYALEGISSNISIYVPCGFSSAYQSANGWSGFSNYFELECHDYEITTGARPVEGGSATGAGVYTEGSTCTLTATANDGYDFVGWEENGVIVSENLVYSFAVTSNRHLVAYFISEDNIRFADSKVKAICVTNWDTNGDGELSYIEAGAVHNLGSVFSNNIQITSFDELQYFNELTTIGAQAFMGCSNLASVTIPASVTSIGSDVFAGCTGLNTIVAMPETPPSLGADVFQSVSNDAALHVPCSSLLAYQLAPGWKAFGNYYALDCTSSKITATVTPAEGGSVMGLLGVYANGTTCSLTAVANDGYLFMYWTDNGYQVSSDAEFSFVVHFNRNLVAHFKEVHGLGEGNIEFADENVKSICILNWDANSDGELSYEEAAMVTSLEQAFYGNNEIFAFDELQYFINLNVISWFAFYNCANLYTITIPNSVTSILHKAFAKCYGLSSMTVLAETPPELQDGSEFSYTGTEFPLYVPCGCSEAYRAADGWNVFTNIQENCTQSQTVTQTINLLEGWNWISTYIESDPINMLEALESALGEHGIQIKSKDKVSAWDEEEEEWDGSLQIFGLTNGNTYMVQTNSNCTVFLEGPASIPADYEITLFPNTWTWIGFPCAMEVDIEDAFANFIPMAGDQIKSKDAVAAWDEEEEEWSGSMSKLIPGTGYMFFSNSAYPRTLIFQTGTKSK